MSDPTRQRVVTAFDRELEASPVLPGLRQRTIRAAVSAPVPRRTAAPGVLALVAAVVAMALIATLVLTHPRVNTVPAVKPSAPPPPRSDAAVVYDGAHGQLLLFGGNSGRLLGDTWTWDGKNWYALRPGSSPSARMEAAAAYDEVRHVVVLFGGRVGNPVATPDLNDTWTWDGKNWAEQHPAHSPDLSFDWPATMGFDPASRSLLLFGFAKTPSNMTPETWSWNGSDWRQLTAPGTPVSTGDMFSDGNHLYVTTPPFNAGSRVQMSEWDGRSWIPVNSQNALPADSALMAAAFDIQRDQLVVLNGDTWTWDRSRWVRQHPDHQPPMGYMVYFASLHEVVSFGERWGTSSNAVWGWNGTDWLLITAGTVAPPPTPSGRFGPSTPAAAEAFIRQTVTASTPVLMPAWLPNGMEANVDATLDYFTVTYRSDQRDKEIYFGIVVANPPPATGPHALSTRVKFRNAIAPKYGVRGDADYVVYDTSDPYSQRYLDWIEPGTMANPQLAAPGLPYFLSATGLTDQEFWQVANSLR